MSFSVKYDKEVFKQAFKKDMEFFKQAFPDFVDFENPGDDYLSRERNYKLEAVKEAEAILAAYRDGESNPLETFLKWTKLANFFDWRMVDKAKKLERQDFLSNGLKMLYDGILNNTQPSIVFNSVAHTLLKSKMSAGLFLQTILHSYCLKSPDRYFGLNTQPLQRKLKQYGFPAFKQGYYITWDQFQTIQEFGQRIKQQLAPYKPKDMIDVQSFLYVTGDSGYKKEVEEKAKQNRESNQSTITDPITEGEDPRPCWFVGAMFDVEDQTDRFLEEGIWQNGYTDKYLDQVKSIQPGDRIAIKSAYTRRYDLPFDNHGQSVSVMAVKAKGIVTRNFDDGRTVEVDWTPFDPLREWYFYTNRTTVWCVKPGEWITDALIRFTFEDEPQEIDKFLNTPYWNELYGDTQKGATIAPLTPYTIDDIIQDGCFLEQDDIEKILRRLKDKKNLVLQGPPGTGKTWLAKRLAYALIGQKDKNKVRPVQFHPGMSYEDFVRGYRPNPEGKLDLVDGPFVKMCEQARDKPESIHVIVIEEINRGNPAQIFGEMLTLMEADKRNADEAILLSYGDKPFHIPENLYIIGTMNLADRSLALVDFALRRRFAFVDLEPAFKDKWSRWIEKAGIDQSTIDDLKRRITEVNKMITENQALGKQFCIGHSYLTPPSETKIQDAKEWFRQIVETEIGPLLDEYLYDNPTEANKLKKDLLENL